MPLNEDSIAHAIKDVKLGLKSMRQAASDYGLQKSTLARRIQGDSLPHAIAHAISMRLTLNQEQELVNWILQLDLQGRPPSHSVVRAMASRILI